MKVIFLQDVPPIGREGEVREVANGYGRNFLLPRKLALLASPAALKMTEAQQRAAVLRRQRSEEELRQLAEQLDGLSITIKAKVAKNRLYGSIRASQIAQKISREAPLTIEKESIELEEPIRQLGEYEVPVNLAKDIGFKVKVIVEEETSERGKTTSS